MSDSDGAGMLAESLLGLAPEVRYVAVYDSGRLELRQRDGLSGASETESDRYEELLVNPTVLKLTSQRGNIDCGGLEFVLVRYGNFFQLVVPTESGHVSVALEPPLDVVLVERVERAIRERA